MAARAACPTTNTSSAWPALINLLADVTGDGYVFRVDMRLRPNGDAGPLACSLGMLEEYLVAQGREWERYAWIKGRVVSALDTPHAQRTADLLARLTTPFVFRRYLDYGVIAAIRSLHAQIRSEAAKRSGGLPGHGVNQRSFNIKLGRGGIREIEFMAQVFQLIRGGRTPRCVCGPRSRCWPLPWTGACCPRPWPRNWPMPTASCASSNTGCSTATTPRPTTCRPRRKNSSRSPG